MLAILLLALAAIIILYTVAGYPILLASFWRGSAAVRKDPDFRATVSVVIAVRNGEEFIRAKLENLFALNYPAGLLEIQVVSDGSTDRTEAIVESFSDRGVHLLRVPGRGKPAALNAALRAASGEILFFTDVRQKLHPDALVHLVANFADPTVGVVTGEPRFLNPDFTGEEADMEIYWRYELWARRRHSQIDSACNTTGWIYAMRHKLAERIPEDTLVDDAVLPLKALLRGYRVIVEPLAIAFDNPKIQGGEFRRKLRTLAGLWQVHVRMPELFTCANRIRFHFFSHKSSRLVLPWAILLACTATTALPYPTLRGFLLAGESVFFVLAIIDRFVPKNSYVKRISSPVRSFLMMNAASLLSLMVFVLPPGSLWRQTRVKGSKVRA